MAICFSLCKLVLFLLDFLFVVVGLVVAAIGIWTLVDGASFFETVAFFAKTQSTVLQLYTGTQVVVISSAVLIALGSIVFTISFCGCWGVVSENRCLLITYASLMSLIVFVEVIGVILLFTLNSEWQTLVNKKMFETFSNSYRGAVGVFPISDYKPFSLALDAFMIEFKCCGINGPADFDIAQDWLTNGRKFIDRTTTYSGVDVKLPVACCPFENTTFFENQQYSQYLDNMIDSMCPRNGQGAHNTSCANIIPGELERNKIPLIVTPVLILVLELLCIGVASYMAKRIKRYESAVFY